MKKLMLFLIASLWLSACAASPSQDTYLGSEVGMGQVTDRGEIVAVRPVMIERTGAEEETFNTIATGVGAVLGVALAVLTGSPDMAKWLMAAAGGAAGYAIGESTSQTEGVEYIIAREDGSYITVVTPRESEEVLESGSEVIVVESAIGYARILPVDLSALDKGAGTGEPPKDSGEGPASGPGGPWMDPDKDLDIEIQ
jgi:outer membrane lipoprotein SlyB